LGDVHERQDRSEPTNENKVVPVPSSSKEATTLLSEFRPPCNTPEDLSNLLNAKADPNIIMEAKGAMPPLMTVIAFAKKADVRKMRQLLLEAGAHENNEARERWLIRRRADDADEAWMESFHGDADLVALVGE
jgi:hypothetical protein